MSYKERELTVSFTLANGTFDGGIGNTLTVKGFKCEAAISAFGGATGTMMELSLWGLSLENMAKLTTNAQKIIAVAELYRRLCRRHPCFFRVNNICQD
jgi:hypothetical protein